MKLRKVSICLILVLSVLFSGAGVLAYEDHYMIPDEISVSYNGERIDFEDVQPIIVEGRTMVPLRGVFEKIGAKVEFDSEGQRVIVTGDAEEMVFRLGEQKVFLNQNGKTNYATIEVAPFINEGRTLVPIRFISETLGFKVNWNGYAREVVLIDFNQWKNSMKTNASFAHLLFDQKLWYESPAHTTSDGKLKIQFQNSEIDEEFFSLPESDIVLEMTTKDVAAYDGKNYRVNTNITVDLTPLQIFAQAAEAEELVQFLKEYDINITLYLDEEYNLYIKSEEILEILIEAEVEQAKGIGDRFLKIPLKDLLLYQAEDEELNFREMTYWDMMEKQITSDNYLYTTSVKQMDDMFRVLEGLFHNEKMTAVDGKNGEVTYSVKLDTEAILALLKDIFDWEEWAEEETLKLLESLMVAIQMEVTAQDGVITDSKLSFQLGFEQLDLDGYEITFIEELEQQSTRTVDDASVKPISLPEKVIDVYEIE